MQDILPVSCAYYVGGFHDAMWRCSSYSSNEISVAGFFLCWYLGRDMGKVL